MDCFEWKYDFLNGWKKKAKKTYCTYIWMMNDDRQLWLVSSLSYLNVSLPIRSVSMIRQIRETATFLGNYLIKHSFSNI